MDLASSVLRKRTIVRNGLIAIVVIVVLTIAISDSSSLQGATSAPPSSAAANISDNTGISQSTVNGENAVVARYHLSASASDAIAQDAATSTPWSHPVRTALSLSKQA